MADIVATDAAFADSCVLRGCKLDVEYGDSGENSIQLSIEAASGQRAVRGGLVYVEGTEYGGIIDRSESDSGEGLITYEGRSWHGMLEAKVIEPPAGQTHRTVSGDANAILLQLIGLLGLGDVMTAPAAESGVQVSSYSFDRYCAAYTGVRKMLASAGARLSIAWDPAQRRAVLSAVPAVDWTSGPDSDVADVVVGRVHRTVNHLISLGEGEGTARAVRHDYVDAEGNISQVRTFSGVDEITEVYEVTYADAEELAERAPERLRELIEGDSLDASLDGAPWDYAVGDVVSGTDVDTGDAVRVEVGTKIAVVTDSGVTVEYKAGGASVAASARR